MTSLLYLFCILLENFIYSHPSISERILLSAIDGSQLLSFSVAAVTASFEKYCIAPENDVFLIRR